MTEVAAEDLLAYVYALGATAAFTDRFDEELAEAAGPIHIPVTADPDLFRQAVCAGPRPPLVAHLGRALRPQGPDPASPRDVPRRSTACRGHAR